VLAAEQVLVWLRLPVENVPLEFVPEVRVDDRHRLNLAALREDGQAFLRVVEVSELNALECALADSDLQQQVQREPVAAIVLSEDRPFLVLGERRSLDAAFLRRADRPCRVAVQLPSQDSSLEEALDDRDVLGLGPRGALAATPRRVWLFSPRCGRGISAVGVG
jgi:hypothetical protein